MMYTRAERANQIVPFCTLHSIGKSNPRHSVPIHGTKCKGLVIPCYATVANICQIVPKTDIIPMEGYTIPLAKRFKSVQFSRRERKNSKREEYAETVHYSYRENIPCKRRSKKPKTVQYFYREENNSIREGFAQQKTLIIPLGRQTILQKRDLKNENYSYTETI